MRRLLVVLIWLLPLLFLIVLGESGLGVSPFLVTLILLILFLTAMALMGGSDRHGEVESEDESAKSQASDELIRALANELQPFLSVNGWKTIDGIVQFEGSLRTDPKDAINGINGAVSSSKLQVILTEGEQNQVRVTLVSRGEEEPLTKQPNWLLHGILLLLTIATTTWAGAMHQGVDILKNPANFAVGLPYSIG